MIWIKNTGRYNQTMLLSLGLIILFICNSLAQQPTLTWVGTLGGSTSKVVAVSSDGSVVTGVSMNTNGFQRAFRWTAANGMQDIGTLGGDESQATGISADGSIIVGWSNYNGSIYRAFKWTAATGMQDLGAGDFSKAYGVSEDGSAIIVDSYPNAYRWTQAGGLQNLGTLGGESSQARGISADGSKICGFSYVSVGDPYAFRWVDGVGLEQIGTFYSFGRGISGDGLTITGFETGSAGIYLAFKWTQSGGFQFNIAGNFSEGNAVSGDGSIIVGLNGNGAFRLSDAGGLEALNQVYSSLLNGSYLSTAQDISPNGQFIVGWGTNAATSQVEGYLISVYGANLVSTTLTAEALTGSQTLEVASISGFNIGDNIKINPGGPNEETNTITGFGSLLIQNPLQFDHSIGEIVLNLNPTAIEENNPNVPLDYALFNNYPNPFNPSTKISWQSPVGSHQTLKVYDVLGNEVATLVDEYKPAGRYEVEFSPSSLPSRQAGIKHHTSSGVYLCRLQTDNFSKTIKMLYLK